MRRPGAGRKRRATQDPTLLGDLETLVEPTTRGWSPVALALDLQKCAAPRHRAAGPGAPSQSAAGQ